MIKQPGGVVLCGGASRRMGQPKAWLRFGEEHLLQRVVRILLGEVEHVVVAAKSGQSLPPLPPSVVRVDDQAEHCGPLAGLAAGLTSLNDACDAVCVASCDHPLLSAGFVRRLFERLDNASGVVPSYGGRLFPLMAVYRPAVVAIINEMMRQRAFRAMDFVERCRAEVLTSDVFVDVDPDMNTLINVNDEQCYVEALSKLGLSTD